jgi:hypothetical protein
MSTIMVDTTAANPAMTPDIWEERLWYVISFSVGTLVVSVTISRGR